MTLIAQAQAVLGSAENQLQELIKKGLRLQRYQDLAELAKLAESIAGLRSGLTPRPGAADISNDREKSTREPGGEAEPRSSEPAKAAPQRRDKYPRFERDDGRLVKVGWSKRHKSEYEHKAPKEAVQAFCRTLASDGKEGVFKMERYLPAVDDAGREIPDYQAYLTLAWLRSRGMVTKKGRDGYRLRNRNNLLEGFDEEWEILPERSGGVDK